MKTWSEIKNLRVASDEGRAYIAYWRRYAVRLATVTAGASALHWWVGDAQWYRALTSLVAGCCSLYVAHALVRSLERAGPPDA